jgi:exodeoxyribonuclease VII large subunit
MNAAVSLYELTCRIRNAISTQLPGSYWVRAEISEGRQNANGHFYCRFIEKNAAGTDIASAAGIIWAGTYVTLRARFERETGQRFGAGIKVLVRVRINFHERYGLSLLVEDIDPSYTLGDMVRRRKEIIDKLTAEGVVNLNKQLVLPRLLLRIAVITSETAAGFGDFCNHLAHGGHMFNIKIKLFPAIMQGDKVEQSVINALNAVLVESKDWDAVVIIRGGGAVSDLNGFDTYLLAANVAQFPLPVITGIGHDRDETVLDLVANVRCKTPTAVADFLIERLSKELELLENCAATLKVCAQNKLNAQLQRMDSFVALIPLVFSRVIDKEKARYRILSERLPNAIQNVCRGERSRCERLVMRMEMNTKSMIANMQNRLLHVSERLQFVVPAVLSRQKQRLESCERGIRLAQPERVLKLGFSLTLKDGKAVTDASQLSSGDRIVTRLSNGEVTSRVE